MRNKAKRDNNLLPAPPRHTALPHEFGRYRSKADVVTSHMTRPGLWVHGLGLQEAGVEFICADMPFANRLTVGVMALVAAEEGRAISARTKAALAAAKARGVKLGGDMGAVITPGMSALGVKAVKERSRQKALDVAPIISQIKAEGAVSLRAIARGLNDRGVPAPRGGLWGAKSVQRVLERI